MQLGTQKNQTDCFFSCLSKTSFVICVQLSIVLHIFRVYFYNSLHVIIFLSHICSCFQRFLMFLTISHVFAAMFSFCALVSDFPMESWSCCHGGQTQISRPKNLKYIFINIEIWNQMLICRIDAEMYILTKIFSGICAIWHNSALCHPAPNCKKSLGPGFAPMCSSLYSPQGFDTFPISLIFISCVDLDEDP